MVCSWKSKAHIPPENAVALTAQNKQKGNKQHKIYMPSVKLLDANYIQPGCMGPRVGSAMLCVGSAMLRVTSVRLHYTNRKLGFLKIGMLWNAMSQ